MCGGTQGHSLHIQEAAALILFYLTLLVFAQEAGVLREEVPRGIYSQDLGTWGQPATAILWLDTGLRTGTMDKKASVPTRDGGHHDYSPVTVPWKEGYF